jgi:hypothetical protein
VEINMKPIVKTYSDGTKKWWLNGRLHREDGPVYIGSDGTQIWYLNGKYHREDGPAVVRPDGTKKWYLNDEFHREDGPAIIWPDGTQRWYLNGKNITKEITNWVKERNIDLNMSEFDKMVLKIEIKMWK